MDQVSRIGTMLVVDAETSSVEALRAHAKELGARTFHSVAGVRRARAFIKSSPDIVLLETTHARAQSLELLRMIRVVGRPRAVFVMGQRENARTASDFIDEGADAFLEKPVTADCLRRALKSLEEADERFEQMARWSVGRLGLRDALEIFRVAMQKEAMRRTKGSARGTASLLDVDRHYIQRAFRKLGVGPAGNDLPPNERRAGSWPPSSREA
jgi:DNA-binding response OmpR family regulator